MYSQRQSWLRRNVILVLILIIVALIVGLGVAYFVSNANSPNTTGPGNQNATATTITSPGYQGGKQYFPVGAFHVQGNLFVDSTGHKFLLHGAQIPGEFNARTLAGPEIAAGQHLDTSTFQVMNQQWNMNALRIPTCDYMWQADPTGYLARLDPVVQAANAAHIVVVLDLHEDDRCGAPTKNLNFKLPLPESAVYWKAIATHYKNNPDVIFDVFNEPAAIKHNRNLTDANWQTWLHGGTVEGTQVVGMQDLVNAIRSTGAQQVVMVEGLGGGDTFHNIGTNLINDSNIVYEVHIYFAKGELTTSDWDTDFGFLAAQHAVYVGEWALLPNAFYPYQCKFVPPDQGDAKVTSFMNYMDAHNVSWTAWAFTLKHMILNYSSYTPTTLDTPWTCGDRASAAGIGTIVKQHLLGYQ